MAKKKRGAKRAIKTHKKGKGKAKAHVKQIASSLSKLATLAAGHHTNKAQFLSAARRHR